MKYAIQSDRTKGNAHILEMQDDGTFMTIGFTAGDRENVEACKLLVNRANEFVDAKNRGDM